jgi:hypothetical protein
VGSGEDAEGYYRQTLTVAERCGMRPLVAHCHTALVLSVIAWYGGQWFGGLRWVLLAAVAALTLPFPAAAAIAIFQRLDATRYWRTLEHPEAIAGLSLPTGSELRFADKAQSILLSIELPYMTEIRGMRLTGPLGGGARGKTSARFGTASSPRISISTVCHAVPAGTRSTSSEASCSMMPTPFADARSPLRTNCSG